MRLTIKDIIDNYIEENMKNGTLIISSATIQNEITQYIINKNKLCTPETVVRIWRRFKNENTKYLITKYNPGFKTVQNYYLIRKRYAL
jgi:hypothetical protein